MIHALIKAKLWLRCEAIILLITAGEAANKIFQVSSVGSAVS
jgi:hypothetical protein